MYYYLHNRTKTPQDVFSSRDYSFSLIVGALGGVLFIAGAAVANDESAPTSAAIVATTVFVAVFLSAAGLSTGFRLTLRLGFGFLTGFAAPLFFSIIGLTGGAFFLTTGVT